MLANILHVEDDPGLAEVVPLLFEDFGFHGQLINAATVVEAEKVLDDRASDGGSIDLIISDMNLPDGSGLDVVRFVRGIPEWEQTPIVILSGDPDPTKVGRAYALGANAYIAKMSAKRPMHEVIKTLYDHWARDAVLPHAPPADRAHALLRQAVRLRCRRARLFQSTAERFGDRPSESAFWLTRALGEANLANILRFLQTQIEERDVPADLLDTIAKEHTMSERELDAIEREHQERSITSEDAYRQMLELMSVHRLETIARTLSYLFPVAPVASAALRDLFVDNALGVVGWIEMHTDDPTLRDRAAELRAALRALSLAGAPPNGGQPAAAR